MNNQKECPKGKRKATGGEIEVMEFLNELRESGEVNMFGAVPYVEAEFGYDRPTSKTFTKLWRENFNKEGDYQFVNI
jgi:hypothetical protein